MTGRQFTIEGGVSGDELTEFWLFANDVYAERPVHWTSTADDLKPLLKGEGPAAAGRTTSAFVARSSGKIVARAAAIMDEHYVKHWGEPLGHVVLFEALPGTTEAVCALMDEACGWLRERGLEAARTGWSGSDIDWPYTVDAYDLLPPPAVRQNPAYYHALLKEARFVGEKRLVDYKIEVTPELVQRWEHMLRAAEGAGFSILSFAEADHDRRVSDFNTVWEAAFARHWGISPGSMAGFQKLFEDTEALGAHDASVLAYRGDEPVGTVFCLPELSRFASLVGDRQLLAEERLNLLGIGVLASARGTGLNLGLAARSYLELVKRGSTHISYTHVVEDNWPSRRTAEKLGARVCANYLAYRRDLLGTTTA